MSKPGCCCKSANEPSPNCAYCGNKKQTYYNDQYQNDYQNEYQGYSGYAPYNQGSDYSYGTQRSEPKPNYSEHSYESGGLSQENSSWALLKPVLVFGAGCYLTSKMVIVASELG